MNCKRCGLMIVDKAKVIGDDIYHVDCHHAHKMSERGLNYECPKCGGKGYIMEKYNAYPMGLPDSGWVDDIQFRKIDCDICHGNGYTKKLLKPKTEISIIGYE